jgi:hypothetical protein
MTALTTNELNVLNALRGIGHESVEEYPDGRRFGHVYLDNGIDTTDRSTLGTLASLEKKGYYEPVDGYAWGAVLLED